MGRQLHVEQIAGPSARGAPPRSPKFPDHLGLTSFCLHLQVLDMIDKLFRHIFEGLTHSYGAAPCGLSITAFAAAVRV